MNHVLIEGRLTQEPASRFTETNKQVASFSVAHNQYYQSNGEWRNNVSFFMCEAWGKTAEKAVQLNKGQAVIIEGQLKQESWDGKDGQKVSRVKIVVKAIRSTVAENGKSKNGDEQTTLPGGDFNDDDIPF